jgi:nucleoid-associated protein YgaU
VVFDLAGGEESDVEIRAVPLRVAPRFQPTEVIPSSPVSVPAEIRRGAAASPPPAAAPGRRPRPTIPPPPPYPRAGAGWRPPVVSHHYTVTRHDVGLIAIARAVYGDASLWPKIWLANLDQMKDPSIIRAGQRLRIPDKAPLTRAELDARDAYNRRH